jgi:hypothetical protein
LIIDPSLAALTAKLGEGIHWIEIPLEGR